MPNPDQIPYVKLLKRIDTPDSISDIPLIGDVYDAGNAVINFIESDCRPGWDVYVETLFPALGDLFLGLIAFDLDDILRGYFRPGGGRGFGGLGRASRRTPRLTKAAAARGALRGGIPEMGELIGRNLPGATLIKGRNVGSFQRWAWHLDGIAQRGLWYWLVVDLGSDFIINWTTGILESEECIGIHVGGFTRTGNWPGLPTVPEWGSVDLGTLVEQYGPINAQTTHVFIPDGYTCSAWMTTEMNTAEAFGPAQGEFSFRWSGGGADTYPGSTPWSSTPADGGQMIGTSCTVQGPGTLAWGGRASNVNFCQDWELKGILRGPPLSS